MLIKWIEKIDRWTDRHLLVLIRFTSSFSSLNAFKLLLITQLSELQIHFVERLDEITEGALMTATEIRTLG